MKKAFTLIEILIVVILLGILAAVVIPQFFSATDDARMRADETTNRTLQSLVEVYRSQHGSYPATLDVLQTQGLIAEMPGAPQSVDVASWTIVDGVVTPTLATIRAGNDD